MLSLKKEKSRLEDELETGRREHEMKLKALNNSSRDARHAEETLEKVALKGLNCGYICNICQSMNL